MDVKLAQNYWTHHDINLTFSYGETQASYWITNNFKGYSEVDGNYSQSEYDDIDLDLQ